MIMKFSMICYRYLQKLRQHCILRLGPFCSQMQSHPSMTLILSVSQKRTRKSRRKNRMTYSLHGHRRMHYCGDFLSSLPSQQDRELPALQRNKTVGAPFLISQSHILLLSSTASPKFLHQSAFLFTISK